MPQIKSSVQLWIIGFLLCSSNRTEQIWFAISFCFCMKFVLTSKEKSDLYFCLFHLSLRCTQLFAGSAAGVTLRLTSSFCAVCVCSRTRCICSRSVNTDSANGAHREQERSLSIYLHSSFQNSQTRASLNKNRNAALSSFLLPFFMS